MSNWGSETDMRQKSRSRMSSGLALALLLGGVALLPRPALAAGRPEVRVTLSSALAARTSEIGRRDLQELQTDLAGVITRALSGSHGGALHAVRVDVVLEDAQPNRPTVARLAREPSLSLRSLSLGGARVSGRVTSADGSVHDFDLQRYSTDLRDDVGATTWTDAEIAFDQAADDLAHGRLHNR